MVLSAFRRTDLARRLSSFCVVGSGFRIVWYGSVVLHNNTARLDVHFRHPGALHHRVEGHEVLLDEADQIHWVVLDLGHGLAEALEAAEIGQHAQGQHGQGLRLEVAEIKPVGPDAVEVLVELAHLGDGVEFLRVVVVAVYEEAEPVYQRRQGRPLRQDISAELLEEVG